MDVLNTKPEKVKKYLGYDWWRESQLLGAYRVQYKYWFDKTNYTQMYTKSADIYEQMMEMEWWFVQIWAQ